jgi:pimeloyl-ACP methyl ester carboxylesterase
MMITPFTVHISQAVLDDLQSRIKNTRWTDEIIGSGWSYGANLSFMQELAKYWVDKFDWRKAEDEINGYPNFIAEIDGCKIHFLYIKGKGRKSFPLIITHGWPGSFLEMTKIIPLLTDNEEFSFDLVIPSIPGYGFSQKINTRGCNSLFIGELWYGIMKELGYKKFGVQGGDFGASVGTAIALKYQQYTAGLHLNYIPGSYKPYLPAGETLTEEEIQFKENADDWYRREGAYSHQHITKPLTLAYGLNDSPVGLCAWITEKLYGWSDCKNNIENIFTKDEILSNVTLYWVTGSIHSSIRLYNENSMIPFHFSKDEFVNVPVGIARFPLEEPFPPRRYIERGYNIQHWTDMPAGAHFAAMEQPQLLASDITGFFKKIFAS